MRRREFILGSMAAAWPVAGRAQQSKMPVVGLLRSTAADYAPHLLDAFRRGLEEAGWVEGRNVAIEIRNAENRYELLPALASELVRRPVAVIVATGAVSSPLAAKAATTSIPIIFVIGSDPVQNGLVASLNRPNGNVTGVTFAGISGTLLAKRVELLREVLPHEATIGLLVNPGNPNSIPERKELEALARSGGWTLQVVPASSGAELEAAFDALVRLRANGILQGTDAFFSNRLEQIVALANRHSLAAIYSRREFATAGGLMSYGPNPADTFRLAGVYAGRILKGAKPADLPVQLPTKFELVVNLKAAKASGLTVPTSLLLRADEVIE
jgi:putative ABC transport system substrate-binding protein